LLVFVSLWNTGCVDPIEFDIKDADRQIVVYTEIHPGKTFQVKVSTSALINTNQEILYPEDALISVSNDGDVLDKNFTFRSRDMCYLGLEAEANVEYTLNVSLPDHYNIRPISSTTTIPASQQFGSTTITDYEAEDMGDNTKSHRFWVEFSIDQSTPDGSNYFQVIPQRRKVEIDKLTGDKIYLNEYKTLEILEVQSDGGDAVNMLSHKEGIFIDGTSYLSGTIRMHLETENPLLEGTDVLDHLYLTLNTLPPQTFEYNQIKEKQLALLAGLLILVVCRQLLRRRIRPGVTALVGFGMLGTERFLVEFVRAKDDVFFGGLTLAQAISLALLLGLGICWRRMRRTTA
jgi:hypothetical protein